MKIYLLFFLLLGSPSLISQTNTENPFPQDFFGNYKGMLEIDTPMGLQKVPMEFRLHPTDSVDQYQYILVYGDGEKRQERSYTLIAKEKSKGQFLIDENNGILLEAKVFQNQLYSIYEVSGNLLTTFIAFESDRMNFEITVARTESALETKEKEEGTEVISYPVFTRQRAFLYKQ